MLPELVVVEVGAQVCDDAMRCPVAMHEFIQEVEYSISLWAGDHLNFDPLVKLVDSHQNSV
jgi:hypothetical protein